MKQRLLLLQEQLQTSIWFIPALFCLAGIGMAITILAWDRELTGLLPWLASLAMPVASARHILGVITGSLLSIGGVVFSVTMVALTLTSGQYGPKVLRQFLGDRDSKVCLGLFIGTSLYCLVTLAGYQDGDEPGVTVAVALLLTVTALASFVHFIHRSATDLQADQIIGRIGGDLCSTLAQLSDGRHLRTRSEDCRRWRRRARGIRPLHLAARESGYIQGIDYPELVTWCEAHGCAGLVLVRAGDFVARGTGLIKLYPRETGQVDPPLEELMRSVQTGPLRTPVQDPEYAITQLNQLAARALSPGINDPGTAITCIDWFSLAVAEIIDRDFPGKVFLSARGEPVLLARFTDFPGILKAFYAPARQFARENVPVLIALLESLIRLAELTTRADRLRVLASHGRQIRAALDSENHLDVDLNGVRRRLGKLQSVTGRRNVEGAGYNG